MSGKNQGKVGILKWMISGNPCKALEMNIVAFGNCVDQYWPILP